MLQIWVRFVSCSCGLAFIAKISIVERVVLHMVEPPPAEPSECLRIFVVFSGMAGAWRATKELDGRFFGGKKIASLAMNIFHRANLI